MFMDPGFPSLISDSIRKEEGKNKIGSPVLLNNPNNFKWYRRK
jgi:hypothetical protein